MHEKSIGLLNRAVGDELSAVHQYMYFHFHCHDQGYDILSNLFRMTAIQEMMHVELIAERILFLKGEVKLQASEPVKTITDVTQMLQHACKMEEQSILDYNKWALECSAHADSVSRKLFETLVEQEETHYGQYDNEADKLVKYGEKYLALQSIERSKATTAAAPPA